MREDRNERNEEREGGRSEKKSRERRHSNEDLNGGEIETASMGTPLVEVIVQMGKREKREPEICK